MYVRGDIFHMYMMNHNRSIAVCYMTKKQSLTLLDRTNLIWVTMSIANDSSVSPHLLTAPFLPAQVYKDHHPALRLSNNASWRHTPSTTPSLPPSGRLRAPLTLFLALGFMENTPSMVSPILHVR